VVASWDSGSQDVMMMRGGSAGGQQRQDPLIYPGLYSPSGFDMMGILVSFSTFLFLSAVFDTCTMYCTCIRL
jgi:hypothetical protein